MCEISKIQRRIFRDQDPPRIRDKNSDNKCLNTNEEFSKSTPNSPTALQQRASSGLEKCSSEPEFLENKSKDYDHSRIKIKDNRSSLSLKDNNFIDDNKSKESTFGSTNVQDFVVELSTKVPSFSSSSSSSSSSSCDKKQHVWRTLLVNLRQRFALKSVMVSYTRYRLGKPYDRLINIY
ncbi:hypothetical protein M0802_004427 [Mischocyttarus mexicanus]|nr:hypothetical protein M0802_004427 [Mischocyttarus mexicanus]